jgi:uncharacterized coiled-coil protein SlyX
MSDRNYKRFVTEEDHEKDMNWASKNFENLDKKIINQEQVLFNACRTSDEDAEGINRNFKVFADAHNKNVKRIKRLERHSVIQSIALLVVSYVVAKHDKILDSYKTRLDRVEAAVRYSREQRKADNNET